MKTTTTLAVAALLNATNAAHLGGKATDNKALAEEYLRQVYAQVGETYLAQTDEGRAARRRRTRVVIPKQEFKTYENIYPPAKGAVAKLRGVPWPCSSAEPCGEGEGTCFNPYETTMHPDEWCAQPFYCQNRLGGSRGGPGEEVHGVVFSGALKQHHVGANDICFDMEFAGEEKDYKMAVLRRKLVPCTHDKPCLMGEGDCDKDDLKCDKGLKCAFRADDQTGAGEPVHGIDFTGDLLMNADGANDVCYDPKWPETDAEYEGKLIQECDMGGNNCGPETYLIFDSEKRLVPDQATFDVLWPADAKIIKKPERAFEQYANGGPLCELGPIMKGDGGQHERYWMVDNEKRLIENQHTWEHLQFKGTYEASEAIHTVPQCALDAIEPPGTPINYLKEDEH